MSARNMAQRTAAGTLALAVCLGGGALAFAGAANALPTAGDITGSGATSSNGLVASQVLRTSGQSLTDFSVTLPAGSGTTPVWKTGDRVVVQLPPNVALSSLPTVTAVKAAGDGTLAPTFTVAQLATTDDPTTDNTHGTSPVVADVADPVAGVRQVAITFTNTQTASTAEVATSWQLKISGVKVDLSNFTGGAIGFGGDAVTGASASASTATYGKVYGQTYDANSGAFTSTALYTSTSATDVVGYALDAQVSIASNYSYVNGGGAQAAPDVTITEPFANSFQLNPGTLSIQFKDAAGHAVELEDGNGTIGTALAPSVSLNGTALTSGTVTFQTNGAQLTTPNLTSTTSVDKVVIGNLRFKATQSSGTIQGPIKAYVSSPQASAVAGVAGNQAVSGDITINDPNVRLGGATRYDTAAQITAARFNSGTILNYVLASGEGSGVDALSANYVAGAGTDKPVVLTSKSWLPDASLAFLKGRIGNGNTTTPVAVNFTVMGGKAAVDDSVLGQIKDAFPVSAGYNVTFNRYAGDDRYETAAAAAINTGAGQIASFSNTYGKAAVRTAILASGENSADAVTAGGIAYGANFPLLLTASGSLPSATVNALQTLEIKQVVIVGGPKAVSTAVEDKLKGMGITVIRKYGDDRFGTALQVAEFARTPTVSTDVKADAGLGWNSATYNSAGNTWAGTTALLGNGSSYADLLAAGQLSASASGTTYRPVLTTDGGALTDSTKKWLTDHKVSITGVVGLGGANAVSWDALTAAVNAQK